MITPQQVLLQKVKDIIPSHRSLADELAALLDMSPDSAYRRIRGETKLTLDEAALLCLHYQIPPDSLMEPIRGSVNFLYRSIKTVEDFNRYLSAILDSINQIKRHKDGQLIYAGNDVPVFYHFMYPEHASFKVYFWLYGSLRINETQFPKFKFSDANPQTLELINKLFTSYQEIATTEIWSEESVKGTLKQIKYCWEAGLFENPKEAKVISQQYLDILKLIQERAQDFGVKGGSNKLFYCETPIGNNCVLVKTPHPSMVYLGHQTIKTMITTNQDFCNETASFLEQLMKRSLLISGSATKQRNQFFQALTLPVQNFLEELSGA